MTTDLRDCPIPHCSNQHKPALLMCYFHWRLVPRPLQREVWRTYRELGVLSEEYLEARDAAIASVS